MTLPRPLNPKGPLLNYLQKLYGDERLRDRHAEAILAVRDALQTEAGAILMELLENSTLYQLSDTAESDRALAVRNAQSLIASDLRRILSSELDGQDSVASVGRKSRR